MKQQGEILIPELFPPHIITSHKRKLCIIFQGKNSLAKKKKKKLSKHGSYEGSLGMRTKRNNVLSETILIIGQKLHVLITLGGAGGKGKCTCMLTEAPTRDADESYKD